MCLAVNASVLLKNCPNGATAPTIGISLILSTAPANNATGSPFLAWTMSVNDLEKELSKASVTAVVSIFKNFLYESDLASDKYSHTLSWFIKSLRVISYSSLTCLSKAYINSWVLDKKSWALTP